MNDLIMTLFLQEGTIVLNQGIIDALGRPNQVQMLFDADSCQLLLRACGPDEEQVIVVGNENMAEVAGQRLLKRISKRAKWDSDTTRYVYGVYLPDYNAVGFNMQDARPISEMPGYEKLD